jgi:carbonic anhydrase
MQRSQEKGLVALCMVLAAHLAFAQSAMPSVFSRKSVSPAERAAAGHSRVGEKERATGMGNDKSEAAASGSPRIKTATPANAEAVLRSALASVNSGMTEVLIRTSDWDNADAARERSSPGEGDQAASRRNGKSPASAASRPRPGPGARWGYAVANGPSAWGNLSPEFRACGTGRMQSPIDIWSARAGYSAAAKFTFSYASVGARVVKAPGGGFKALTHAGAYLTHLGETYYLESVQFRMPGEGRVDGIAPVMSIYLHHRSAEGKHAIVSVPVQVAAEKNPSIERLLSLVGSDGANTVAIETKQLLPDNKSHFHYIGSLTQPPCTEGVAWFIMREPVHISRQQFMAYSGSFTPNARPVQQNETEAVVSFSP